MKYNFLLLAILCLGIIIHSTEVEFCVPEVRINIGQHYQEQHELRHRRPAARADLEGLTVSQRKPRYLLKSAFFTSLIACSVVAIYLLRELGHEYNTLLLMYSK